MATVNTFFIYHFVNPDFGVVIFVEKEWVIEKGGVYFDIGV